MKGKIKSGSEDYLLINEVEKKGYIIHDSKDDSFKNTFLFSMLNSSLGQLKVLSTTRRGEDEVLQNDISFIEKALFKIKERKENVFIILHKKEDNYFLTVVEKDGFALSAIGLYFKTNNKDNKLVLSTGKGIKKYRKEEIENLLTVCLEERKKREEKEKEEAKAKEETEEKTAKVNSNSEANNDSEIDSNDSDLETDSNVVTKEKGSNNIAPEPTVSININKVVDSPNPDNTGVAKGLGQ